MSSRVWWEAATNNYRFSAFREALYPVDETHSAGRNAMGGFRSDVSCHWMYLWPQGAVPPGFNPLWRGWVYRLAPEAPLLRGMPTGSEAFLEMPGACGIRPCTWPHPKKGLVPNSSGWWDGGQIPSLLEMGFVCFVFIWVMSSRLTTISVSLELFFSGI